MSEREKRKKIRSLFQFSWIFFPTYIFLQAKISPNIMRNELLTLDLQCVPNIFFLEVEEREREIIRDPEKIFRYKSTFSE